MGSRPQTKGTKYGEISDDLRERIVSGEYPPGAQIPGEDDLMSEWGVARETARKALQVLRNEGLTEVHRGVGIFVRSFSRIRRDAVRRLSSEQWGGGRSIWDADVAERALDVEGVAVDEVKAPEDVARVLDLGPDAMVCRRSRRYVVDGTPVMTAVSYLPADIAAGTAIAEPDPGPGGIYARLADLGFAPAEFREEVVSRMPRPAEVESLRLDVGTPVITIARTAYAADGRAVEFNDMTLNAAAYVLDYRFSA
ncbi:GntR family transcriptional regulator [Yinghuangia aomiensis]|uniref:GntR family transcriptional regulator n=1 Tax=Yinghuangia aomiensis TaxID=676205 RepID=A0ABP9HUM2_9ACTN